VTTVRRTTNFPVNLSGGERVGTLRRRRLDWSTQSDHAGHRARRVDLVRRGATFGLDTPLWAFDPPLDSTRTTARHRVLRGGAGAVEDLDDVLDDYFPQIASQWTHSRISPLDRRLLQWSIVDDVLTEASIRSITGRATGRDARRFVRRRTRLRER